MESTVILRKFVVDQKRQLARMLGKHILNSSPNKVVQGSRFEALSTDEELNAHETASTITRIREMIISAGLIPSAKGKDVSDVGVGSSKGRATAGVSQVRSVLDSLEAIKEVPPGVNGLL
ncbi:hypothetical protein V6N13_001691 [Hibiscus sabdariffa]